MDRRLTPANGRVAARALKGRVKADSYSDGETAQVCVPVADLIPEPGGRRARQLLMGAVVTVYEVRDGMAFVRHERDGYVGYVPMAALGPVATPTHWVAVPASHAYTDADIKAPEAGELLFGNAVRVVSEGRKFMETDAGTFVPARHVWPVGKRFSDPVLAAQLHFGMPYLWGGNSVRGIDCSGLVQAALFAAGQACPGDCDLQAAALGRPLAQGDGSRRGDLVYWAGHVGMMVDGETMIHANAHHMAVAYEPLAAAIARIEAQGEGPVTARKRL